MKTNKSALDYLIRLFFYHYCTYRKPSITGTGKNHGSTGGGGGEGYLI